VVVTSIVIMYVVLQTVTCQNSYRSAGDTLRRIVYVVCLMIWLCDKTKGVVIHLFLMCAGTALVSALIVTSETSTV